MRREEVVNDIREGGDFVSKYLYDFSKDDLRRLVIELRCCLVNTSKRLAQESLEDKTTVILKVYGELADELTDAWTYDGEWLDNDDIKSEVKRET